ncbi:extracellular solute-binding protein [Arthrobacter bambusae]|uniref:extracellular solute-binding protein n=1 Tax=Arthrobacter bambusae TaxID=1338426 RepID=UPI002789F5F9|nr:extracellular solute-binding protein [Arthrobacter bambusae]MDQ0210515.1 multiple sugar transport system substrate-binding protein [Arthrobacter bambusae]MDQ0235187.1 multiple sugar transport system substrate-binding protein [Arthrobacter bambusae]
MKHGKFGSRVLSLTAIAVIGAGLAACGGGASSNTASGANSATTAKGPIKIWYSNNEFEVKWGKDMVASWNAAHPDQPIDAQEIPAGKTSEEVIGAAITAGNAPCLVFNTAPVAVPQFQKQGGLVPLDSFPDGAQYIKDRTGDLANQYKSSDGKMYQLPWKSNPVVLFYNKDLFAKAGLNPANPKLGTQQEFLDTARTLVKSGATQTAIWPSPTSDFYQPWFDFYPFYAASTQGTQLLKDGKSTFDSDQGKQVATMFQTLYKENLASKEAYKGDSFADGKSAMALAGPWAIDAYKGKVNWGTVPVPGTQAQTDGSTFSDAKNIAMYSACKNQGTAWEVMKFATSKEQDGKLLSGTGQMPMRKDLTTAYPDYFNQNPAYKTFADQAARTVEVPNVSNSVQIWQTFRDAWSKSVIFGNQSIDDAFKGASDKINQLAAQK